MDPKDYRIAIICALATESACVEGMLDEQYPSLTNPPADINAYVYGRIGSHNVVLACLPAGRPGEAAATAVASRVVSSFPNLRFSLMVGIGGGAPDMETNQNYDIRLGDVVVSKPSLGFGGVIQYDFGKTRPRQQGSEDANFVRTGWLNAPPTELLNFVARLQARHLLHGSDVGRFVHEMTETYPSMQQACTYLGSERDQLFKAEYEHTGGRTCENCNPAEIVPRTPRQQPHRPVIYYGTIASANQVMRDGRTRDKIAGEYDAICFEMEAAGLMNEFQCLVIRGICDYADSHKNKDWQLYAAATAAAYAKELLTYLPPSTIPKKQAPAEDKPLPAEWRQTSSYEPNDQFVPFPFTQNVPQLLQSLSKPRKPLRRLWYGFEDWTDIFLPSYVRSFQHYDYVKEFNWRSRARSKGTCQWLTGISTVTQWIASKSQELLWISGEHGVGKTTSMTFLVRALRGETSHYKPSPREAVVYAFANSTENSVTSALFSVIIHQLLSLSRDLQQYAFHQDEMVPVEAFQFRLTKGRYRSSVILWDLICGIVKHANFSRLFMLFDGLDQCDAESQRELFSFFLSAPPNLHILVASRPTETILAAITNIESTPRRRILRMDYDNLKSVNAKDINLYIGQEMNRLVEAKILSKSNAQQARDHLEAINSGRFLPVALLIETLSRTARENIDDILNSAQESIPSIFSRINKSLGIDKRATARKGLQYILNSFRPLTLSELAFACSAERPVYATLTRARQLARSNAITEMQDIIDLMFPLLKIQGDDATIHVYHAAAREFLEERANALIGENDGLLVPVNEAQKAITIECLDLIIAAFDFPFPPSWRSDRFTLTRAIHANVPTLAYATQYWVKHLQASLDYQSFSSDSDLKRRIGRLNYAWHDPKHAAFIDYLREELEVAPSPNMRPTLLDIVTRAGLSEVVQFLVGIKQNDLKNVTKDTSKVLSDADRSSVMNAISSGSTETLNLLIRQYGIESLNDPQFSGCVDLAVQSTNMTILRTVLKLRDRSLREMADALSSAVVRQNVEAINLILHDNFLVKARDSAGKGVLHHLIGSWSNLREENTSYFIAIIEYFVAHGLDINMQDNWGNTILTWQLLATTYQSSDLTYALLKCKVEPLKPTATGILALHAAAYRAKDPRVIALLLSHGGIAQLGAKSRKGHTVMHWAACRRDSEETSAILDALLRAGADPHALSDLGVSPIQKAREHGGALASFQTVYTRLDGVHNYQPDLQQYPEFPEGYIWDLDKQLQLLSDARVDDENEEGLTEKELADVVNIIKKSAYGSVQLPDSKLKLRKRDKLKNWASRMALRKQS